MVEKKTKILDMYFKKLYSVEYFQNYREKRNDRYYLTLAVKNLGCNDYTNQI